VGWKRVTLASGAFSPSEASVSALALGHKVALKLGGHPVIYTSSRLALDLLEGTKQPRQPQLVAAVEALRSSAALAHADCRVGRHQALEDELRATVVFGRHQWTGGEPATVSQRRYLADLMERAGMKPLNYQNAISLSDASFAISYLRARSKKSG
jgi:hypothetical protein